jgi:hypothetical protein
MTGGKWGALFIALASQSICKFFGTVISVQVKPLKDQQQLAQEAPSPPPRNIEKPHQKRLLWWRQPYRRLPTYLFNRMGASSTPQKAVGG